MLKRLTISNYALIEELDIDFTGGFTIITGETGAGKSILLGALSLILGQRADSQALFNKDKKCVIEGTFLLKDPGLKYFFTENELDYAEETIIRREITPEGKSRTFINDTPVTLNQLKEIGSQLVDIHSQHETLLLNRSDFQISVLDAYARHQETVNVYKKLYKSILAREARLVELKQQQDKLRQDQDYYRFQLSELEGFKLEDIRQEELEQELETLNHSEEIKLTLEKTLYEIKEGEQNLLNSLNGLLSSFISVSSFFPPAGEFGERIKSCSIELKDIAREIESAKDRIIGSPERIVELNDVLNTLYNLQQKHHTSSVPDLIALRESLREKMGSIESLEGEIGSLEHELSKGRNELLELGRSISAKRAEVIPLIEGEIGSLLHEVALPNAVFRVQQETNATDPGPAGIDTIKFLFSANKGIDFKELGKVASGGELSRLMLCIKTVMAKVMSLPTIIFDEIDTGISGEVAFKVGGVMSSLSSKLQVIAITHLPQIAGKGGQHYFVYKELSSGRTVSNIRKLNTDERINEIAKMISGEKPTAAAIENARELLGT